ncbi:MAG: hypothetical protein WBX25_00545 [Rhodomicrobium sp.]
MMRSMLAVAALLFCSPASAGQKPTATEVFHLRSECSKLGKQLLWEVGLKLEHAFSSYFAKYDEDTNRCFVLIKDDYNLGKQITLRLYDGQGAGMMATWTSDAGGIFMIGDHSVPQPEAYEYIQHVMKDAAP